KNRYNEGKVYDIGSSTSIDYNIVLNISPDIVFLGDWPQHDAMEEKLKELNLTVSRFYTYIEPTFLGRIEWAKFAAAFWGHNVYEKANNYFQNAWKKYMDLKRKTYGANYINAVTFSAFTSGKVYIPQGQNYYASWINDFRGNYIFSYIPGTKSQKIDTELFVEKAKNADVVIFRQFKNITTADEIMNYYPFLGNIKEWKAYKNGRFYISRPDYYIWEAKDPIGMMEDFAKMLHPEKFPNGDNDLKYYHKVK
ncbi:ABC transporter periplasmic subunit, partial [Methanocaldococcus villosus KIN24-T80]